MQPAMSDKTLRALVDRLLFEQGRLEPLELLLAADLLAYEDYEAWRAGRRSDLQGVLRLAAAETAQLLEDAADYARRQKLDATGMEYRGWGGNDGVLSIGPDARLTDACARMWAPAAERRQLDLFHDSGELLLEEAIRHALAERRVDEARDRIAALMREHPRHPRLRGFLRLIQTVDDNNRPSIPPRDRLAELDAIEQTARELLGHRARDFLTALWATFAEQLADQPFDPAQPRLHASHAWKRAGCWDAVREAVENRPDWRDRPTLVLTHAEAAWQRHDLATARRDWAWLCWEHPLEAERALGCADFPDRWLAGLWQVFGDLDEALDTEDFPAWMLLHKPVATAHVPADHAPLDERGSAYRLLSRLVGGADDIALRRQLDELHPVLLRLYLSGRG